MQDKPIEPEFSRPVEVGCIGPEGLELELQASEDERRRLARRLGLLSLDSLSAQARIRRESTTRFRVNVDFYAEVLQSCVISLEPVSSRIGDHFSVLCLDDAGQADAEVFVEPEGDEPPEPIADGRIDLGELVTQYLSLAIDPYPKRPEAELPGGFRRDGGTEEAGDDAEDNGEEGRNPFGALERLRGGRRS